MQLWPAFVGVPIFDGGVGDLGIAAEDDHPAGRGEEVVGEPASEFDR